jgi:hypothetical protein
LTALQDTKAMSTAVSKNLSDCIAENRALKEELSRTQRRLEEVRMRVVQPKISHIAH